MQNLLYMYLALQARFSVVFVSRLAAVFVFVVVIL